MYLNPSVSTGSSSSTPASAPSAASPSAGSEHSCSATTSGRTRPTYWWPRSSCTPPPSLPPGTHSLSLSLPCPRPPAPGTISPPSSSLCGCLVSRSCELSFYRPSARSSPQVGFLRFLRLLSSFDWRNNPLVVNLNSKLTGMYSHTHAHTSMLFFKSFQFVFFTRASL